MAYPKSNNTGYPSPYGYYDQMNQPGRSSPYAMPGGFGGPQQPTQQPSSPSSPPSYLPPPINPGATPYQQRDRGAYGTSMDSFTDKMASGQDPGWGGLVGAMPGYQGILGKDGKPLSMYQYDPRDSDAFNRLKRIGMSKGPTEIYGQQNDLINKNLANDMDRNATESNNAYGMGVSNLAQTGGVDAGSRERLADSSQLGRLRGMQTASNAASLNRGAAGLADAQMKVNLMGNAADVENRANMYNTENLVGDRKGFNQFNQDMYKATGSIYGNNQIANKMVSGDPAAKEKGMFGTGIYDPFVNPFNRESRSKLDPTQAKWWPS